MKTILGNQHFIKCNFCMNWFQTKKEYAMSNSLNICQLCFQKGHKSSCFKILDHKDLRVYDVCFKKSGFGFMQNQSKQMTQVLQLTQKFNKQGVSCILNINQFFSDILDCQQQILKRLQPIRDLMNQIYKTQIIRLQQIWNNVIKQLQVNGSLIVEYREQVSKSLKSRSLDNFTRIINQNKFAVIKNTIQSKLDFDIQQIRKRFKNNRNQFFQSGFKLFNIKQDQLNILDSKRKEKQLNNVNGKSKQNKNKIMEKKQIRRQNKQNTNKHIKQIPVSMQFIDRIHKSPNKILMSSKESYNNSKICSAKSNLNQKKSCENLQPFDFNNTNNKVQISQYLKNKKPVEISYKSNNQKSESCKIFPEKNMTYSIQEAIQTTFIGKNLLQLVCFRTDNLQFKCFMQMLEWHNELQIVKFVKTGLTDEHLNIMLGYIRKISSINTLVLTNNLLTDEGLKILLNFVKKQNKLKNIYLGRNYIKIYGCKNILKQFEQLGIDIYV